MPAAIRNRMTEIFVHEPSSREDLRQLVLSYLQGTAVAPPADAVVDFYLAAKSAAVQPFPVFLLSPVTRILRYNRPGAQEKTPYTPSWYCTSCSTRIRLQSGTFHRSISLCTQLRPGWPAPQEMSLWHLVAGM